MERGGKTSIVGGIENLIVLKTTQSSFEKFVGELAAENPALAYAREKKSRFVVMQSTFISRQQAVGAPLLDTIDDFGCLRGGRLPGGACRE